MRIPDAVACLNPKCDRLYDSKEHKLCPYCGDSVSVSLRDYFKPQTEATPLHERGEL